MPRSGFPPTPVSSTDIPSKDDIQVSTSQISFTLPPPAIASAGSTISSNASVKSDSSYHPVSPTSPTVTMSSQKRRLSNNQHPASAVGPADFSLPPPPTRSRKIIQMKPGSGNETNSPKTTSKGKKGGSAVPTHNSKKQPTVAVRKTARKTAHSLIERRRRSKMNEEFGVLKDMIPACQNQEMHKLAILQASIDYLRYLEQCVTNLKAANGIIPAPVTAGHSQMPTPQLDFPTRDDGNQEEDGEEEDQEMEDEPSAIASPALEPTASTSMISNSRSSIASPTMLPTPKQRAHASSHSSTSYSLACLPPLYQHRSTIYQTEEQHLYHPTYYQSAETSPAILPHGMEDADHEATAALLMLNADRRGQIRKGSGKAMSVKDLLSS